MGLQQWNLHCLFGVIDDEGKSGQISAACVAHPKYLDADLYFDLRRMATMHDSPDMTVRHEMLHIFLWELAETAEQWAGNDPIRKQWVSEREERTTTLLERMPVWET